MRKALIGIIGTIVLGALVYFVIGSLKPKEPPREKYLVEKKIDNYLNYENSKKFIPFCKSIKSNLSKACQDNDLVNCITSKENLDLLISTIMVTPSVQSFGHELVGEIRKKQVIENFDLYTIKAYTSILDFDCHRDGYVNIWSIIFNNWHLIMPSRQTLVRNKLIEQLINSSFLMLKIHSFQRRIKIIDLALKAGVLKPFPKANQAKYQEYKRYLDGEATEMVRLLKEASNNKIQKFEGEVFITEEDASIIDMQALLNSYIYHYDIVKYLHQREDKVLTRTLAKQYIKKD